MQEKHYLEKALHAAIKARHSQNAMALIKEIEKDVDASLQSFDSEGRSFLALAIEYHLKEVFSYLFLIQSENDDIIFARDKKNRTLAHMAAISNQTILMTSLLEKGKAKNKLYFFLSDDEDAQNILHYAVLSNHSALLHSIFAGLSQYDELSEFINSVDLEGNTALFEALAYSNSDIISFLINHGASLKIENNKKETPFMLICKSSDCNQKLLFRALNRDKQAEMLQLYHALLLVKLEDKIKDLYFECAGIHSLRALLIAYHEFGDAPIRNHYNHISRRSHLAEHGTFAVKFKETPVSDAILKQIPLYTKKVLEVEREMGIVRINLEMNDEVLGKVKKYSCNYEILNEDRIILASFIADLQEYLNDLQQRPKISKINRGLVSANIIFLSAGYIGIESYLFYKLIICFGGEEVFFVAPLIFGIVGGVVAAAASVLSYFGLWNKEVNVSSKEWEALTHIITQTLLDQLQSLENQGNTLPSHTKNVTDLSTYLTALKPSSSIPFLSPSLGISVAIQQLQNLKTTLENIRNDLNKTKKPFSLFKPVNEKENPSSCVIDMPDDILSDDEETIPLLNKLSFV